MKRLKFPHLPKVTVILHGHLFGVYHCRKRHLKGKIQSGEILHLKTEIAHVAYNIIIDKKTYIGFTGVSVYDSTQLLGTNLGDEEPSYAKKISKPVTMLPKSNSSYSGLDFFGEIVFQLLFFWLT